jgi:hypothetical protein
MSHFTEFLDKVTKSDSYFLKKAFESYGDSWKKRGGIGAFMMLARKWDRLEHSLEKKNHYDIFKAIEMDRRAEGIIDDIRDLRRYLVLVEAEMMTKVNVQKDLLKEDTTGQDHPFGYTPEDDN